MLEQIHTIVWGPGTLLLLLLIGIIYCIRSRFFQLIHCKFWWQQTVGSLFHNQEKVVQNERVVTPFQSACTALAATVGTGNIVGVATALIAGGPGAVFWMWVSALIGMVTAYAETMLGVKYRYKNEKKQWMCGPMIYLEKGLGFPVLGFLYGLFCMMASFGMGSMVQSNSIAATLEYSFSFPVLTVGIVLTILVCMVIKGGINRIAFISERLIPISAGIYILFSAVVIFKCYAYIPHVLQLIFQDAFQPVSAVAGTLGYGISKSMRYGIARGVFSNEAGLGSLAIIHGAAENTTPEQQGMWAVFEVFFDTIVVCTLTALVILCVTNGDIHGAGYDGAALTSFCFSQSLGGIGEYLVSLSMLFFAFGTIIAWFYLGKQAASYIFEKIGLKGVAFSIAEKGYLVCYLLAVFIGCIGKIETVWQLSDIWNGCMAIPNILALWFLQKEVIWPIKRKVLDRKM